MMFKDALFKALAQKGITASQLSRMTDISKASISLYLSGKSTPTPGRVLTIIDALGLPDDYFVQEPDEPSGKIARLKVDEVARMMGLSRQTVSNGLQDGIFPWGYAIRGQGDSFIYWINAKRFFEIEGIQERGKS